MGIPRALLYYEYYPLWKTFFEELGAEVVLSAKTNKKIIESGLTYCVNEACLPVKIFHGAVSDLIGKVDCVFLPRIISVAKREYICPKFSGLPDMIRSSLPNLPPVIDTEINLRLSDKTLKEAFIYTGKFITDNIAKIIKAYHKALRAHGDFVAKTQKGVLPAQIFDGYRPPRPKGLKIAVVGHIYNLFDSYANNNLFKRLYQNDISVITPETLQTKIIDESADKLNKKLFWSFARKIMGAVIHFTQTKDIDGVMYIMSFGCGIDSFIADLCERKLKRANIPFYLLVIDEHSGEAGLDTRIEAFVDMLKRRKTNDSDLSAHG